MSLVKSILVRTGAVSALIAATGHKLRILMYHGISPFGLQPETFERHLRYLRERFECVWASQIPEILDGDRDWRKPPLVLTFDDGLRNNLTYAAPLLESYDVKATFYIVSDLLDGKSMLWNHDLLCRLLLTDEGQLPLEILPVESDLQGRFPAISRFVERVKGWDPGRRSELLESLRRRDPEPEWEPWMLEKYCLMSRQEVLGLPDNIEIGSHTRTHPILPCLDDDQAREEIEGSRRALESLMGRPVVSFCYPDGQISDRDELLAAQAYAVAVSVEEGLAGPNSRRHRLPRIPAAGNLDDFELRMIRPGSGGAVPARFPELQSD